MEIDAIVTHANALATTLESNGLDLNARVADSSVRDILADLRRKLDVALKQSDCLLTIDEAREEVDAAMLSVNPELAKPSQWARASARVTQRGDVFDVLIAYAGPLFPRYATAIRDRLGHVVDVITQLS